jgi:hypothetical protein
MIIAQCKLHAASNKGLSYQPNPSTTQAQAAPVMVVDSSLDPDVATDKESGDDDHSEPYPDEGFGGGVDVPPPEPAKPTTPKKDHYGHSADDDCGAEMLRTGKMYVWTLHNATIAPPTPQVKPHANWDGKTP